VKLELVSSRRGNIEVKNPLTTPAGLALRGSNIVNTLKGNCRG
jgi:hypothetical protein